MTGKPTNIRWILAAFLLGTAAGGLTGWQAARHGGWAPRQADGTNHPGTGSHINSPAGESPDARQKTPAVKFTPSGDADVDFHRILRLRDAAARAGAFRELLESMTPDGMVKLMGVLNRYGEDQEQEDQAGGLIALMASRQLVIEQAARSDPAAVLAALSATGQGRRNGAFYQDVLRGWAARDPEAARRFFEQTTLQDPTLDAKAIAGALVRELVKTDPEGAFRWLRGLKADFTEEVAHDALQTLSHYDGVKAGQLLAQNSDLKKPPSLSWP